MRIQGTLNALANIFLVVVKRRSKSTKMLGGKCCLLFCVIQVVVVILGKQLNLTQEALDAREQHRLAKKALKHDRTRKGVDVNSIRVGKIEENINLVQHKGISKTNIPGGASIRGEAATTSSNRMINPITTQPKVIMRRNDPTLAPTYPPIQPSQVTSQCVERVNSTAR